MADGKNKKIAWLYLAPALFLLLVFTFYPIVNTFIISVLVDYDLMAGGFDRISFIAYWRLLNFPAFRQSMYVTAVIVFITVPLSIIIALLIAVTLNSIKPFQKIFQTIFFLPYVTNSIAIGMVFAVMFQTQGGLINRLFGINVNWIAGGASFGTGLFVLSVFIIWNSLPFMILIFLSGLQNIDKQYYQAAKIDGASKKKIFRRITVPLLSPMIAFILITSVMGAFREFTAVIGVFGVNLGPVGLDREFMTIVGFIYEFMVERPDYAAAAAVILFVIILLFTAINFWVSKKRVHY
ncbi:MAG: sugar ABC transporter permease [Erysipelotrichales bacterium]|nr:sugar ABC transporter permease [Erysipelotrichales bacterium]